MEYISTLNQDYSVDFRTAFMVSQPPKSVGGLYVPKTIPKLSSDELEKTKHMKFHEIATLVNNKFIDGEIPEDVVLKIMKKAYNFDVPLQKISDNRYLSWLTKGPSFSYKDLALTPIGPLYDYLLKEDGRSILVVTSSTGDTAPAAISTMKCVNNALVVVGYPEVTPNFQKIQMCTQGAIAIEVEADFDFILSLQKKLCQDGDVKKAIKGEVSTLNSTNHQRITNEITYYIKHYAELVNEYGEDVKPIFSVPCGNYSNLTAGLYAKQMGVPIEKLIIASNINDTVPRFLITGKYEPKPTVKTLATAMDISKPNNFKRDVYLYGGILDDASERILKMPDLDAMRCDMEGITIDNDGIKEAMRRLYGEHDIFICPHGAVAEHATEIYIRKHSPDQPIVSFMTADPAKFSETVTEILGIKPHIPHDLEKLANRERVFHRITKEDINAGNSYERYKGIILEAVEESGIF